MFDNAKLPTPDARLRWRTVPIPRGTSIRGVIAGPMVVVQCHWCGQEAGTKPCRRLITNGKVPCYCEEEPRSLRTYGYLPLYAKDGEQVVVICSALTAWSLREFTHGTPVELVRPDRDKTRLRPRMILQEEIGLRTVKEVKQGKPADIKRYLIYRLWQDEVLAAFFSAQDDALPNPLEEVKSMRLTTTKGNQQ